MIFFFFGYLVILTFTIAKVQVISELIIGSIFFFGSIFVFLGIILQKEMLTLINSSYSNIMEIKNQQDRIIKERTAQLDKVNQKVQSEYEKQKQVEADLLKNQSILKEQNINLVKKSIELSDMMRKFEDKNYDLEISQNDLEKTFSALQKSERKYAEAERALRKANEILELRVKERTAELEQEIEERKYAETRLRRSEARYRLLAENSSDVIWTMTLDGRYTYVSPSVERLSGFTPEETLHIPMEKQLTPSSVNKLSERIARELELLPENRASVFTLEIQQYTKDKSIIDTEVSVSWMLDKKGEPSGLQGITRDITHRKRAEEEKRKLEAQLQRSKKMEAIGTLAGGVAHDLNNILSGIVSYPELLLLDIPSNSPMRKPILTMKKSGEMAVAIVQDLLTLARRGVAVKEVTDLNAIISEYLKSPEFQNMLSFHPGVTIDVHLEKTLFKILGSPVHLSKTVMNLITNAAEAIQNEGTVFISTESQYIDRPMGNYEHINEGDYVVFIVQDTGSGIASADLDKIFEPFFTKKIMGRSGTGLGMAVVWGTVKDHDGHIEVQSAEGKGTTFKIYFPITRQETTLSKSALSIENYRGNGETILIVDDVSLQREIASGMLEILGYRVKSVKSGEEAVEYLKIHSTDLLFLDMVMTPGIDGLETYKRILDLHPNQKAIIASGFSETERVKEAQMLGAGQYLKKPYALEKLGVAVKNELARNRNLEQMGQ